MTTTVDTPIGSENCLPIGTRLHDFEITGILGEGGFGIVYSAFDHSLQRNVAIKEYMPGALAMRGGDHSIALRADRHKDTFNVGLKSFINEARFLAQFDHPALVKVYRFWEQNQTAYTAMRYYTGRTIKDLVAQNPELITEARCKQVLRQILEALETLYAMKILHRDISPDNIIVQENGDAVLLDFGSARQIIGDMTQGLTVILKPGYAPAEQYAGDASLEQGPYTDIYSLCAVIYFAIMKVAPPTSIARMIKDPMGALLEVKPAGYSEAFLKAIDKGLSVLAQDRPQTIDEFRALLGFEVHPPSRARKPDLPPQRIATVTHAVPTTNPPAAKTKTRITELPTPVPVVPAAARPGVPRWMLGALAGGVVLASVVLYPLLGGPKEAVIVSAQQEPLPDAAAAQASAPLASVAAAPAVPAAPVASAAAPMVTLGASAPAAAGAAPLTPAETPAQPDTINYKLAIKPWGTVSVDGEEKGVSPPLKRLLLTPGKHTIKVVNPNFPDQVMEVESGRSRFGTIEHDFSAVRK